MLCTTHCCIGSLALLGVDALVTGVVGWVACMQYWSVYEASGACMEVRDMLSLGVHAA
jgi:hypothetical protein